MGINLRMKREKIKAVKRTILGKKIKNLRKKGILPANLYGKKIKSQALEVNLDEFRKFYKNAGKTTLIDVELDSKSYPVLIHKLQVHPVTEDFLHVDFHMVSLEEKITAEIPLVITGKSQVVESKQGILIQPLSKLKIEALPTDLPEKIEIDISPLKEVNQEIKVKDLSLPKGIALSEDLNVNSLVVKIGPLEEEVAAPAPAPEAAAETAGETVEGQKEKEADSTSKEKEAETIKDKTQGEAPSKEKPQQK